jgi:anti-sigma factor RsiW
MNGRPRGALTAEMVAYVDNCLPQKERQAFEGRMIGDPAIKSQVAQWLLQNEAIRAAFRDPTAHPAPVAGLRLAARGSIADRAPQNIRTIRDSKAFARKLGPANPAAEVLDKADAGPIQPAQRAIPLRRPRPGAARRIFYAFAGALALWAASAIVFANDASTAFVKAGAAAYRTFAQNAMRPVEIATADRGALNKWFALQIGRTAPIPDLAAAGLILLGGRIVPGADSPAALALYENSQRERIGLYVEALDSPPTTDVEIRNCGDMLCASWTAAGHGFALIGRISGARMTEVARLIGDGRLKL